MRELKETFEILEQELLDPSQSKNFRRVYDKLNARLDDYSLSKAHAELQLICAKKFIEQGYNVDVERTLSDDLSRTLVCDIHSTYSNGNMSSSLIAEAEIGYYFDPDGFLVDLKTMKEYKIDKSFTRIVSKIARYSVHADRFGIVVYNKASFANRLKQDQLQKQESDSLLAMYGHLGENKLYIPSLLLEPPMARDRNSIRLLKRKADDYYARPKVTEDEIRYGKIHYIYVVDTETLRVDRYDLRKPEPQLHRACKA